MLSFAPRDRVRRFVLLHFIYRDIVALSRFVWLKLRVDVKDRGPRPVSDALHLGAWERRSGENASSAETPGTSLSTLPRPKA